MHGNQADTVLMGQRVNSHFDKKKTSRIDEEHRDFIVLLCDSRHPKAGF